MHSLVLIPLMILTADTWELAAEETDLKIYARTKEGSEVREMKAVGLINASPQEVQKIVTCSDDYKSTMPYTLEAKVLQKESDKAFLFYSRIQAPLVDPRDYIIRCSDESDWQEGKGFLKAAWKIVNDHQELMPAKEGTVRLKINEGYWLMEPRDEGKKTQTTYYVYTVPGGSIPNWIANKGNSMAVPEVFKSIRNAVTKNRQKK